MNSRFMRTSRRSTQTAGFHQKRMQKSWEKMMSKVWHRDLSPDLDGNGRIEPDEWMKQCPCFDVLMDYWDLEPEGLLNGDN